MSGAELAHPRPGGVPPAVLWVIRCMNLIFNFLNALWFSKMLKGAIKVSPSKHNCIQKSAVPLALAFSLLHCEHIQARQ